LTTSLPVPTTDTAFTTKQNSDVRIPWKKYYDIFTEIKERNKVSAEAEVRRTWHPATLSYAMEKSDDEAVSTRIVAKSQSDQVSATSLPDDYTDDGNEDVDDEDEGGDSEHTDVPVTKKKQPPKRMSKDEYEALSEQPQESEEEVYEEYR
jgi:hypothetical protein